PETGVCVGCNVSSDCQDPSHPFCDAGTNTCVQCLTDTECNNGNVCDGIETCSNNVCHAGIVLGCDDGNPCTQDSCQAVGGCTHTDAGEAHGASCESVTDSALCPFPDDSFRLINLQNPTLNASGNLVQNDFLLNATNPGQAYYNVFHSGAPGSAFNLQIDIPWPFITQGDRPIQVHDATGPVGVTMGDGACFAPTAALDGYTITTAAGNLSNSGNPVILRSDYPAQNLGSTTPVYVSGTVPASGLVYVTVHLNYGLKTTTGWQQALDLTTLQGPDTNLDGTLDGLGGGVIYIKGGTPANLNGQDYTFGFSNGSSFTSTVYSFNAFKKNAGVNGLTLNLKGSPRPGVTLQFWGPSGNLLATTISDGDGFYSFPYKHVGKEATYTVKLPDFGRQAAVKLKANGYGLAVFDNVPSVDGTDASTTNWTKTKSLTNTAP
ncbi:MAG TPA: hypothetical protein VFW45_09925, partial [Candidatus Polarisedimenticolia bacterium]|nr:hypothetical protein [Candidatus Polarisedimenticolia bacterium]